MPDQTPRSHPRSGWADLARLLTDLPRPAADRRACQNDRDHAGGDWCLGWITFRPGDLQAACGTCGAWHGAHANGDPACPRQDGWEIRRD